MNKYTIETVGSLRATFYVIRNGKRISKALNSYSKAERWIHTMIYEDMLFDDCLIQSSHNREQQGNNMQSLFEIESITADTWLAQNTIQVIELGEENTYYTDEFGSEFYCKNYPELEVI